jgi:hypothetical protein
MEVSRWHSAVMTSGTWFSTFAADGGKLGLPASMRDELARLDERLFGLWNLGDNVLLGWTATEQNLLFLSVRHYAIAESAHAAAGDEAALGRATHFINEVLSGPKRLEPDEFARLCRAFGSAPEVVRVGFRVESGQLEALISDMVRCYGVSLVRNRAVILLDAVAFSVRSPLDQMAMLNSLSYSVNSAYAQLRSKDIRIDFARTTTGDGFYVWNRATAPGANTELYKLMMMMLADNAAAQAKARSSWVPKLRAAFHVGEHYEFHQVEGLSPTNFSYIVGQVTVDLARMLDRAVPGQILLGDFVTEPGDGSAPRCATPEFVENAAATLEQLNGLDISGGRIEAIRCYLTGPSVGDGRYRVDSYSLSDKHGATRIAYNAKINIHREKAEPIFLGLRAGDLRGFEPPRSARRLSRISGA